MRTKISGSATGLSSLITSVITALAALAGVNSVHAQGFVDNFSTISPAWQVVGSPVYFTSGNVGGGNYALFVSASPGGYVGGGTRAITGAGSGDWSATLGLMPTPSLTGPTTVGHLDLVIGFQGGQSVTLAMASSSGTFGVVGIGPEGTDSGFNPYVFTSGSVFYPMSIVSSGGNIGFSFGGNNFWNTTGNGLTPVSVSLLGAGGVPGYIVDDLMITATAAPEPTTAALFGLGLIGILFLSRRPITSR